MIALKPQSLCCVQTSYAASVASSIGSTIEGSSFSGLLTRVEIGHIRIKSGRELSSQGAARAARRVAADLAAVHAPAGARHG
jgi:hypothetical protein